jgi:hypothetical protein
MVIPGPTDRYANAGCTAGWPPPWSPGTPVGPTTRAKSWRPEKTGGKLSLRRDQDRVGTNRAKGSEPVTVQPQTVYELQKTAREQQASENFKELYKRLAGISQRRRDFVIRCSAASFGVARRMRKGQGTDSQIVTLTPCAGQVRMIRQLGLPKSIRVPGLFQSGTGRCRRCRSRRKPPGSRVRSRARRQAACASARPWARRPRA